MASTGAAIISAQGDTTGSVWAFRQTQIAGGGGGGGVTSVVQGSGITVTSSGPGGTGAVTVAATGGGTGTVTSVTASGTNIVIGGTPTVAPTVALSATPSVTSLTTPIIANAAGTITINPATAATNVNINGIVSTSSAALGTTLGDTSTRFVTENIDANSNKIFLVDTREAAGNDWTTAGTRFGQIIDSVAPKGFVQFGGSTKAGSVTLGTYTLPSALVIYENGPAVFGTTVTFPNGGPNINTFSAGGPPATNYCDFNAAPGTGGVTSVLRIAGQAGSQIYLQPATIGFVTGAGGNFDFSKAPRFFLTNPVQQPVIQYGTNTAGTGISGTVVQTIPEAYSLASTYVVQVTMRDAPTAQLYATPLTANTFTIGWSSAGMGAQAIMWTTFGL